MEQFFFGLAVGLSASVIILLVLQLRAARRFNDLSLQIAGLGGEERLRTLEQGVQDGLRQVRDVVHHVDTARGESIARLETVVRESQRSLDALDRSTTRLNETLSSSQARGQWGERMADDILRAAGLLEGPNYRRNVQVQGGGGRPDYTFLLPEGRVLHMDVKFPMDNYVRYLDAIGDDDGSAAAAEQFLNDVRTTIKNVAGREYIDPSQGTLDFMLVFIPNEHIYAFIHQRDHNLASEALSKGVVLCSPLTLFALLSVIRQAADSFALAQAADQMLRSLGAFNQQWPKYQQAVDAVGSRIESLQRAFDELSGRRTRALERRLRQVEQLRIEQRIDLPVVADDEDTDDMQDAEGADDGEGRLKEFLLRPTD